MAYLPELHHCHICGKDLGPDNGDAICGACDELICDDCGALMLLNENYAICPECGYIEIDEETT
jgi:hypothetical protein